MKFFKKGIVVFMTMIMLSFSLVGFTTGCGSSSSSSKSTTSSSSKTTASQISESEIETNVENYLYNLSKKNNKCEPSKTKYNITSTKSDGDDWMVYGTYTLYDNYGKVVGSYSQEFCVKVDKSTGKVTKVR